MIDGMSTWRGQEGVGSKHGSLRTKLAASFTQFSSIE